MIGPRDLGWEEVVRSAALTAARWAERQEFGFYSDLARAVNEEVDGAELEPHGHPMNRLLYDIVMTARGFEPNGPMLSAVVVLKDSRNRQPGQGFWELGTELGRYGGSREEGDKAAFWASELDACQQAWSRPKLREFERWLRTNGVIVYE
jgi:hypothetical protein